MLKSLLLILMFVSYGLNLNSKEKYIIGTTKQWGFFASFFNALNHVAWCEKNNKIPVVFWGKDNSLYYDDKLGGNAWEYYFEQVSQAEYQQGDFVNNHWLQPYHLPGVPEAFQNCFISGKLMARYYIKQYINKYIKIKYPVLEKFNNFHSKFLKGKKTIGIHLRGTDKSTEYKSVNPEVILAKANEYRGYQYLVATDEKKMLDLAKKILKGNVIHYESTLSDDGKPLHFNNQNKAKIGEDVLIEVLLLSCCDKLIHTCSGVSIAVLCFNPDLDNFVFPPVS